MHPILKRSQSMLRFLGAYVFANLQSSMEYRSAFITQIIAMIANDCLWLFFWWSYFQQFPLVHGWQNTDIVMLWALSACSFGLSIALLGNASNIASLVVNGGLDAYLGMPRNTLLHVCVSASNPTSWGDIIFAVGAYVLIVHPGPLNLFLFPILVLLGAIIFTSFFVLCGSLAFFLGNAEGFIGQLMNVIISFSTYPMDLFNGFVRLLLFTVIPAGFISFVPLQILHQFSWMWCGAMVGATIVFVVLAVSLFNLGLRRYESGNLLGMQS
ncbi:ABC transporter permease [Tengunoibacter tsumagoiensis]|uniref:ABC transporter permease n=1 Tax=Tengunoibacter tsumagoiensis TaxID=2014871 RepID=A0A402A3N8_9CHLR|nr:ABC-2 family transporter protein [Tengunoibacter tsumagoiensis]GCE13763.1 hypothetical protein KTT_36220 [Tengunoibacter tsumagoiensis]